MKTQRYEKHKDNLPADVTKQISQIRFTKTIQMTQRYFTR